MNNAKKILIAGMALQAAFLLISCDQIDLYFFTVGEKKKTCTEKTYTSSEDTATVATVDSSYKCGSGQVEVKSK